MRKTLALLLKEKNKMNKLQQRRLEGKRVFILGSGASLNQHNLSFLKNENVILPNRAIELVKIINSDEWTWCWNDMNYLPDIAQYDIVKDGRIEEYVAENTVMGYEVDMRKPWQDQCEKYSSIIESIEYNVPFDCTKMVEHGYFSFNILNRTYCGWTVVIDLALPLAMWWGCDPIYLIGCDTEHTAHFNSDRPYANQGQVELTKKAYRVVSEKAHEWGFNIINAGIGGSLDAFERVEYKSLF